MEHFTFSKRSLHNLRGLHPVLIATVARALQISPVDFVVVEGLRTQERQNYLLSIGRSTLRKSAHLTGYAADCYPIVNGDVETEKIAPFIIMAEAFRQADAELKAGIRWGGDWDRDGDWRDERLLDGPHFELDRAKGHDWDAPHYVTARAEWGDDLAELLRLDDPELCPIEFREPVTGTGTTGIATYTKLQRPKRRRRRF